MPRDTKAGTTSGAIFDLSESVPSSRSSSPAPELSERYLAEFAAKRQLNRDFDTDSTTSAGDPYDTILPPWRSYIRRLLLVAVQRESQLIAKMQQRVRTPFLDAYFVYTSSLGTHTFFMTAIPMLFFFGISEIGRGLLFPLALGGYASSFVKDLLCSPRPFAPPVTRLTIGTHHLEYGFPSTHSTNSVSIALFLFSLIHKLASPSLDHENSEPRISQTTFLLLTYLLLFYTFSIVFGRLYTAMHSFIDCAMGVIMGASLWYVFDGWFGLGLHPWVERWLQTAGWEAPAILISWCLLVVHKHPQPVDDCPCFEDAIAFISVVVGAMVSRWGVVVIGLPSEARSAMRGSPWGSFEERLMWWGFAAAKMFFGLLTIFVWRLVAKSVLHLILPPLFRFLSQCFVLPNRRFYTPATDYKNVPSGLEGLRAVPSMIDLPSTGVGMEIDGGEDWDLALAGKKVQVGFVEKQNSKSEMKLRNGNGTEKMTGEITWADENDGKEGVKHYDADVLTKVIVYFGIAVLVSEALPIVFDVLGWGAQIS